MKSEIKRSEAHLLVRNCAGLPKTMQHGVREIHDLVVPEDKRGNGLAKKLLVEICSEADTSQINLLLVVSQDGRPNLVKLYRMHGFEIAQDDDKAMIMIRQPLSNAECLKKIH
jgi:N-acetylglutamate synthase-like GNAT family acetyltransferase